MTLPERLKAGRKRKGLTQQEVADHFGIARVSVTQWEGDTSRPDQAKFVDLAKLFEVPLQWLMDGTGEPPLPVADDSAIEKAKPPSSAAAKFLRSASFRFYIKDWREFMGASIAQAARAAGLNADEYQAFETYPINFTLGQVVALASEFGVRGEQFWFPPPKRPEKISPSAPAAKAKRR
jgi:transcriptional regulator with XRE-family HTH domain